MFSYILLDIHLTNKMVSYKHLLSLLLLSVLHVTSSSDDVLSSDLHDKLFGNYKTDLLPVCRSGPRVVNVSLNLALRQIINLDEKDQVLKTNVWVRMGWTDCRLKWNSSEYDEVGHLRVPYGAVWTPDLALYDSSAEEVMMPGFNEYRAQISNNGRVQYNFPTVLNSVCRVTVTYFPFDTQSCGLKFGSWSHSQLDMDFYPVSPSGRNGDLDDFITNNEWVVSEIVADRTVKMYTEPYTDINYIIIMTRRSDFFVMTMMFPCILVTAIAAIGFLLPSESGEKVSLEVTVLLSQAVFLLVISDFLPPSADNFPILGLYFAVSMLLVSLSLVMSVLVLNVHHRGDIKGKKVPKWTRKYLLRNPKNCCSKSEYELESNASADNRHNSQFTNIEETDIDSGIRENGMRPTMNHTSRPLNTTNPHSRWSRLASIPQLAIDKDSNNTNISELLLREQNRTLEHIQKHFVHTDDTDDEREDWQTLARILDRIFLLLYILCFAIVTTVFVLKLTSDPD
ncbi:neuronal acetylcholine receptor subunit alpha-10-like isoform X3 [Mercenaria mercenaria]|uniref:neuronal acetylcholine receptor subunit alpha-10-like isoform X3 n=1 Tax=Mercenaria mercenaria TaxID=6596 RepID=UPI00234F2A4C|nr:neuronal acetylcholine receptor subunit alpha-10-like isoform X3 [Mercenaria mercenaria]